MTRLRVSPAWVRLREFKKHRVAKYLLSLFLVAAATALQWWIWPRVEPAPFLLFYPAVILAALYGDGSSAIVLSALSVQYFFIPPQFSFQFSWPGGYLRIGVFLLAALLIRGITRALALAKLRAEASREAAERAQRLLEQERQIRERFVAALAHDLRTPLTAASASVQLVRRGMAAPEKLESILDRVLGCLDRANRMIQSLLDVHRLKAGQGLSLEFRFCDLKGVVDAVVEELSAVHGARFVAQIEGNVHGRWCCDSLRRVTENLLTNAVKYGAESAPVTIRLRQEDAWVELQVHNHGEPISPDEKRRLFQAFQRTVAAEKSGQPGWGLGLALVHGIVEAHRGSLEVISEPERGTTFRVLLPKDSETLSRVQP